MRVVELSGGVGGARLARGLAQLGEVELAVVVNVGDDTKVHGLWVSPDLDTVVYTLAGVQGPHGWGRAGDSFVCHDELAARFGFAQRFRLGDRDLALNLYRTQRLAAGATLSEVTREVSEAFQVDVRVVPVTDDPVATRVQIEGGEWLDFQDYFVERGAAHDVVGLAFAGADSAQPAPGVVELIDDADLVVVGPSNPPLSIWPILAVPGLKDALAGHGRVVAVSPLVDGKAVKGPADRVMASLGLAAGDAGVVEAYQGLIDGLVVHGGAPCDLGDVAVLATSTLISEPEAARRLAEEIVSW